MFNDYEHTLIDRNLHNFMLKFISIQLTQRAFADAYSAIMASLDWDMSSDLNYDGDYPLLKCLLHSEDVFYSI